MPSPKISRRDALPDLALRAAVHDQRLGRPRQHVDEAGRDGEAGRIDDRRRGGACEVADGGDAIAADADVGAAPGRAGAVVDRAAA